MGRSGTKLLWWMLAAVLLFLTAVCYFYFRKTPDRELGTLVDSFEYLERAVHGL